MRTFDRKRAPVLREIFILKVFIDIVRVFEDAVANENLYKKNGIHDIHLKFEVFICLFQYGLYSAFLGCLVYVIFGTIKESSIGPSAISAILIRENIHGLGPSFAILLCFITGVVQLIMGALQLGIVIIFCYSLP